MKRWCNVKPEDIIKETKRFEDMILAEGARLKESGEKGLEILPGVPELLSSVCLHSLEGIENGLSMLTNSEEGRYLKTSGLS